MVQFRPDILNVSSNRGIVTFSVQTENSFVYLFSCKYLPFIAGKKFTDHIFTFGKGHGFPIYLYRFGRQIYFNMVEVQTAMAFPLFPAYMGVYSGSQLRDTERLCQIVVSAQPQAKSNVILHCFSCEEQNRAVNHTSDFFAERKAIGSGHHNVQYD